MQDVLQLTAWTMQKPELYGLFPITITSIGLIIAIWLAWRSRILTKRKHNQLLLLLAIFLLISEIYKQVFYHNIVQDRQYTWWIFPFQLCSIPMYLCLLLPWIQQPKYLKPVETFLMDFNLLGGVMALLVPDGLMHSYVMRTLHSFLWHFILVFLGFYIGFSNQGDTSIKGFLSTLPIFAGCISIAIILNSYFHSFGELNMFYISPYIATTQPVFRNIAESWGILISNICYLSAMCLGAFLIHRGFHMVRKRQNSERE